MISCGLCLRSYITHASYSRLLPSLFIASFSASNNLFIAFVCEDHELDMKQLILRGWSTRSCAVIALCASLGAFSVESTVLLSVVCSTVYLYVRDSILCSWFARLCTFLAVCYS